MESWIFFISVCTKSQVCSAYSPCVKNLKLEQLKINNWRFKIQIWNMGFKLKVKTLILEYLEVESWRLKAESVECESFCWKLRLWNLKVSTCKLDNSKMSILQYIKTFHRICTRNSKSTVRSISRTTSSAIRKILEPRIPAKSPPAKPPSISCRDR